MKKVLSAKEIVLGCLPKDNSLVNCEYGKITKDIAFEIGTSRDYSFGKKPVRVTIAEKIDNELKVKEAKVFYDEEEQNGGRFVGKYYKPAYVLAKEYVDKLKKEYKAS